MTEPTNPATSRVRSRPDGTGLRRRSGIVALLLALAMVASSCGDDGGDADAATGADNTDSTADDTDAPDDDAAAGDPADDADASGDDEPAPADDTPATVTTRGITDDTIRIGIAIPDVSAFSNSGDQVARYRVVADAINANGGVAGRQIELVVAEWGLLDSAGFDAACTALTQDEEVFAIITRTPDGFGDMTCFTDLGNTITVNGLTLDAGEVDRSDGRLFSVLADANAALLGAVDFLAIELADAKVAITTGEDGGSQQRAEELENLLRFSDIEVVANTQGSVAYTADPTAALAEQDRFAEIWRSSGATHVIGVGNGAIGATYAIESQQLQDEMVLVTTNLNARTLSSFGADLSQLNMIGVATPTPASIAEEGLYGMPECIERVETQLGETVILYPTEEELNALPATFQACASFDFLTAVLEEIGPDLSQEAFLDLTNNGFVFEMTSARSASVDADKPYLNDDAGTVYDWDGVEFTQR